MTNTAIGILAGAFVVCFGIHAWRRLAEHAMEDELEREIVTDAFGDVQLDDTYFRSRN